jgi:hypothetical protein
MDAYATLHLCTFTECVEVKGLPWTGSPSSDAGLGK